MVVVSSRANLAKIAIFDVFFRDAFRQEGPGAESKSESQEVETLKAAKERKLTLAAGLAAFNNNPVKGLRLLQASGVVGPTPVDAAHFLRTTPGLDKTLIGELLGHHEDAEVEIMHAFVQHMDFTPFPLIDEALRQFLAAFRLPGSRLPPEFSKQQ